MILVLMKTMRNKLEEIIMGKKVVLIAIVLGILGLCASAQAADRILAIVNKDSITQSEADIYLNMIILQLSQQYTGKALEEKAADERKQLIEKMIEDKVILQEAKRQGFAARAEKVKQKVEQIRAAYGSETEFENSLKERGLTIRDIEGKLSDEMIMREIIERQVRGKIVISPEEVTKFYASHKSEFLQPETRAIESLYIEDAAALEALEEELENNTGFQASAEKYKAAYANDVVAREQLRPQLQEQIFSLALNEVSKPLKEEKGTYFFKVLEVHPPRQLALAEVHEHIFGYLFEQKFTVKMLEWLEDLKSKSYIKINS
ncbi:MAG TPA: hypothetical protein DCL49_05460 [Candidatus Omnitrophica bacterium]|nr:hypothetical protein [Candidatus Omnitrophota bacterium]HBG62892.1 hypothetical protein [Candidatus Omnitrophota bacterium]